MAETIIRLKVESSEYEQKLKRASQALLQMAENAKRTGAALDLADKEEVEFVRSLGKLQTTATTTRGKVNELSNSFVELSSHYRELDSITKKSAYGKALQQSLDEIKQRAQEAKSSLKDINNELNNPSSKRGAFSEVLDALTSKLGVSMQSFSKFGLAIGAVTGAFTVLKEAFMTSEIRIDAWAKTVSGAKAAWKQFLTDLGEGKINLNNIIDANQSGRKTEEMADRAGSVNANNAVRLSNLQAQIASLTAQKQAGEGGKDVDQAIQDLAIELKALREDGAKANRDAAYSALETTFGTYIKSSIPKGPMIGKNPNMQYLELITPEIVSEFLNKAMSEGQAFYDQQAKIYEKLKPQLTQTFRQTNSAGVTNTYTNTSLSYLSEENRIAYLLSAALTNGETALQEALDAYAASLKENTIIDQEYRKNLRASNQTVSTSNKNENEQPIEGSINYYESLLAKKEAEYNAALTNEGRWPISEEIAELNYILKSIKEDIGPLKKIEFKNAPGMLDYSLTGDEASKRMMDKMNEDFNKPIPQPEKEINYKEATNEVVSAIGDMTKALGTVEKGLEQMGIRLPESMSRLINVISGAVAVIQGVDAGVDAVKTIIDIIAMFGNGGIVHAANGFVVPGMSYSGDKVPALLNSGELVLNRAQQGNLAAQLSDAMPSESSSSLISGEQILIVMNNYLRRIGRGEILTTKS